MNLNVNRVVIILNNNISVQVMNEQIHQTRYTNIFDKSL